MSYQVHLKDREFVSLVKENSGSIGVSSEGIQGLKEYRSYENREDQLKLYLRKQLSLCKSAEVKEILRHVLFEIELIDTHQDKITNAFSRFFTWIIAENQASNYLLMHHDPLKWVDLRRMKRERLRDRQLSLFEGREECEKESQERMETSYHEVFFTQDQSGNRGFGSNIPWRVQEVIGRKKSGVGTPLPHRSA